MIVLAMLRDWLAKRDREAAQRRLAQHVAGNLARLNTPHNRGAETRRLNRKAERAGA